MKPIVTWILIADGARARVLENTGPGKGLREVEGFEFADARLRARDIMADRAGRSFASVGHSRSAMESPTDPVDKREADFARSLAVMLEKQRRVGAFDRLILVAAPNALGDLRASLTPRVRAIVYAELSKDLTKVPNAEMAKHLEGVLAV
ncbi:MAG: host attachment protein [Cucumibacter sp.]